MKKTDTKKSRATVPLKQWRDIVPHKSQFQSDHLKTLILRSKRSTHPTMSNDRIMIGGSFDRNLAHQWWNVGCCEMWGTWVVHYYTRGISHQKMMSPQLVCSEAPSLTAMSAFAHVYLLLSADLPTPVTLLLREPVVSGMVKLDSYKYDTPLSLFVRRGNTRALMKILLLLNCLGPGDLTL